MVNLRFFIPVIGIQRYKKVNVYQGEAFLFTEKTFCGDECRKSIDAQTNHLILPLVHCKV